MDATFWLVAAVAAAALVGLCFQQERITTLTLRLDAARDLAAEGRATVDRLTKEAQARPARGAKGRFTRAYLSASGCTPPPGMGPSSA